MTAAEAKALLERDPVRISDETRDALIKAHGHNEYDRMIVAARSAVPVRTSNAVTYDFSSVGARAAWRAPQETAPHVVSTHEAAAAMRPATTAPVPAGDVTLNAEREFNANPIGVSRASRDYLRAKWGQAEYSRRLQQALAASGQLGIKVTR